MNLLLNIDKKTSDKLHAGEQLVFRAQIPPGKHIYSLHNHDVLAGPVLHSVLNVFDNKNKIIYSKTFKNIGSQINVFEDSSIEEKFETMSPTTIEIIVRNDGSLNRSCKMSCTLKSNCNLDDLNIITLKFYKPGELEKEMTNEFIKDIPIGAIFIENPPKLKKKTQQSQYTTKWSTTLRSTQANLFSYFTGDDYQHVLTYLGEGKVIHTRSGECGIDNVEDFPPFFFETCSIVVPNIKEFVSTIKLKNLVEYNDDMNDDEIWNLFWKKVEMCFYKAVGCSTDVIGIMFTPYHRRNSTQNVKFEPENGQKFSCTGLIALVYKECGIDLFDNVLGVYPSDFLKCKYFIERK